MGLALAVCAGQALAMTPFETLTRACVDTHGDRAKALAVADQAGWMAMPQALVDKLPKSEFEEPQGRLFSTPSSMLMLIVARAHPPFASGVAVAVCALTAIPADPMFDKLAADLAGIPKDDNIGKNAVYYAWREEDGRHQPIKHVTADDPQLVAEGAFVLMEETNEKMSMVLLVVGNATPH